MRVFSIEESLQFGWEKTKQHSRLVFQVVLTIFAVEVMRAIVDKVLEGTLMGIAATIVLLVVGVVLSAGATVISLRIAKNEPVHYSHILPSAHLVWYYVCASIISTFFIIVGTIALIIPGIYLALRFCMVRFAIIDGAEITESLTKSSKLTQGVKWPLLGFFIISLALNILGAILLLVGLLVTLPVTMIAYAHIYQKLAHHHGHHVEAKA